MVARDRPRHARRLRRRCSRSSARPAPLAERRCPKATRFTAPRGGSSRSSASSVEVETPQPASGGRAGSPSGSTAAASSRSRRSGKNLLLTFEGGYVLRSHLRMTGRWTLVPRGSARRGRPWLVLRGAERRGACCGTAPCSSSTRGRSGGSARTSSPRPPDLDADARQPPPRRSGGREVGDALLDQRLVAGIGNKWKAEALWAGARLAVAAARPERPTRSCASVLEAAATHDAPARSTAPAAGTASTAASAARARAAARRSARAGRATTTGSRTGVLAASVIRRDGYDARDCGLAHPTCYDVLRAFCLAAFAELAPEAERERRAPVRRRRAPRPGSTSTGRSSATTSRRARSGWRSSPDARIALDELRARAGGGDLRARHARRRVVGGPRALPGDPAPAADPHGRGAAAASTGRTVRSNGSTPSSSARCSAPPARTRRSRRSSACRSASAIELGRGIRVHAVVADRDLALRWPEARDAAAAALRRDGRSAPACSSSSASSPARTDAAARRARPSSPTPSPRSGSRPARRPRPGRSSSSGSTGTRSGSGRCSGSPRPSPQESRRGSTPGAAALAGELLGRLAGPRTTPSSAEAARALGAVALRGRAAPLRAPARVARRARSAGWTGSGRRRCGPPCSLGETRPRARRPRRAACARSRAASTRDERGRGRRPPARIVEVLLHDERARLLDRARRRAARAAGRARPGTSRRARFRRDDPARPRDDPRAATVAGWRRRGACSPGWSGSRRSSGSDALPGELLAELRALLHEAEAWVRAERDGRRKCRCNAVERCRKVLRGREQDSASLSRKTARQHGGRQAYRAPACPGVDL